MKVSKKRFRDELKRMKAGFLQIKKEKTKQADPNKCLKCKRDAGKNFIFVYKKNNELKGKMCLSCSKPNDSENKNKLP